MRCGQVLSLRSVSSQEFLQILGVIPLGLNLILAGVTWDDNRDNAMNVWNMMEISFDITKKEIEMEDGKKARLDRARAPARLGSARCHSLRRWWHSSTSASASSTTSRSRRF